MMRLIQTDGFHAGGFHSLKNIEIAKIHGLDFLRFILSGRPASILQTIPLVFDLKDDTPLHRRNAPEFKTYFQLIWKELNSHA